MSEAANTLMGDLTYDTAEGAAAEKPGEASSFVTKIPTGKDKALVMKFVRDPRRKQPYTALTFYKHMVGDGDKDTRYHPCRKSLGEAVSPELDRREELIAQLSAIKKEALAAGANAAEGKWRETAQWAQIKEELDQLKEKRGGHILFVEPNSDKVQSLKIGASIINRIFGRKGNDFVKTIPSLLEEMQKKGKSPFISNDPAMNKFGWVKVWRTGEGIATEYFVEPATVEQVKEIEGQQATITTDQEFQIHPRILSSDLTLDDIPDCIEYERRFMWTLEESQEFVASNGLKVPERFLKGNGGDNEENLAKATPESSAAPAEAATTADLAAAVPPGDADVEGDLPSF